MTSSKKGQGTSTSKLFVRFREGHVYRLTTGVLVVIYDTYRPAEHESRQGMGIIIQGVEGKPVGTQLYPISPYEVEYEAYLLTNEDTEKVFDRGYQAGTKAISELASKGKAKA